MAGLIAMPPTMPAFIYLYPSQNDRRFMAIEREGGGGGEREKESEIEADRGLYIVDNAGRVARNVNLVCRN